MAINQSMFESLQPGVAGMEKARVEGQNTLLADKLKAYLQGQQEQTRQEQAKELINDPSVRGVVQQGGSLAVDPSSGAIHLGGNPYAKLAGQGPIQAGRFIKTAGTAYKGVNDQLDAAKATLDSLDLGNSAGDNLAIVNEGKLAAGNSRALGHILTIMGGDPTLAGDAQKAINWLQNSPNASKMQPAQRDALRETVFNRLPQLQQQHEQISQQLMQQGAQMAPQTDYSSIAQSFANPVGQKLQQLQTAGQNYASQRKKMQQAGNNAISNPSTASANPTTLDKLKSFLNLGGQAPSQPTATPQSPSGTMRVKHKQSGQVGTIPQNEFDPNVYERAQ